MPLAHADFNGKSGGRVFEERLTVNGPDGDAAGIPRVRTDRGLDRAAS